MPVRPRALQPLLSLLTALALLAAAAVAPAHAVLHQREQAVEAESRVGAATEHPDAPEPHPCDLCIGALTTGAGLIAAALSSPVPPALWSEPAPRFGRQPVRAIRSAAGVPPARASPGQSARA